MSTAAEILRQNRLQQEKCKYATHGRKNPNKHSKQRQYCTNHQGDNTTLGGKEAGGRGVVEGRGEEGRAGWGGRQGREEGRARVATSLL